MQPARTVRPSRRLAAPLLIAASVALLAGCGEQKSIDSETSMELIQPVARLEVKVAKVEPGKRTGEEIYNNVCGACHGAGALGSPATGDAETWAPRIAKGLDALVASVTNGLGNMPAKGGAPDLTDVEIVRATAYLANQAGAGFEEPPVE